ncbi:hypothetical protein BC828DRAFT_393935 [Blastocladiella britannica]|nr:hypothetical protein BC828DRAFT_393935 [Blastocladiella britannica]
MPHTNPSPSEVDGDRIWYLGYGSNMNPKVLTGRRDVHPQLAVPVVVPGYALTFHCPGFPYLEPSFASIDPRPPAASNGTKPTAMRPSSPIRGDPLAPDLHGVAVLITRQEYAQIQRTEGLGYGDVDVACEATADAVTGTGDQQASDAMLAASKTPIVRAGAKLVARALIQKPEFRRPDARPSVRYHKLLVDGAAHHRLPESYQQWLQSLPSYSASSVRRRLGLITQVAVFAPIFLFLLLIRRIMVVISGDHAPAWLASAFRFMSTCVWVLYAWILRPVFGDGGEWHTVPGQQKTH